MSRPLVTFLHSSRMNRTFRELCLGQGGQITLAIYLLAYLSPPDCDGLPLRTQANVKNHLGTFTAEILKSASCLEIQAQRVWDGTGDAELLTASEWVLEMSHE